VISGNTVAGITITAQNNPASGNLIEGNFIGADVNGRPLASGAAVGVEILSGASHNVIGTTAAGAGNVITGFVNGVVIDGAASVDNAVRGNSIYGNSNVGIALTGGAVGYPNPPTFQLDSLVAADSTTTVRGSVTGDPNLLFGYDFFANDFGFGGQYFL